MARGSWFVARGGASRRTASLSRSRSPLERRAAARRISVPAGRRAAGAGAFGLVDYSPSRDRASRSPSVRASPGRRSSERSSRTPRTSRTPRVSPRRSPPRRESPRRSSPRREYRRRSETPRGSLAMGGVSPRRRSSGEVLPPRMSPRRRSSGGVVLPRLSPGRSRSRRPSAARSASGRRLRGRMVRRRGWSSSSSSSSDSSSPSPPRGGGAFKMQEMKGILDRLEEIERVNIKLKKKDEDKFTWTKKGCETQFKFNNKVKDIAVDKMRVELRKHFKTLPPKIEELIKEGEKEIDDGNHKLKIANDFGFKVVEELVKDDLARNDEEGKKIKRFRKEKKEREEKLRSYRGVRGGRGGFRGFGEGRQYGAYAGGNRSSFVKDRKFDGGGSARDGDKSKDLKCFNCQGFGHMARECSKAYVAKGRK